MLTQPCPAGDSILLGEGVCASYSESAAMALESIAQIKSMASTPRPPGVSVVIVVLPYGAGYLRSALPYAPIYRFKIFVDTVALANVLRKARLVGFIGVVD